MPLTVTFVLTLLGTVTVNAARVVLTLYALSLGAQPFEVGLLAATFHIFPLLLSLPIGILADRVGSRWPLLFSAVCGTCALLIPYFRHEMPLLYVAGALSGLSFAFFLGVTQNLVGLLSPPADRARNFSNFSLMGAVGTFIGPLIAGFSIDYLGNEIAALCAALLSAVQAGIVLWLGGTLPGGQRHTVAPAAGLRDTLADREIWRMIVASSLVKLGADLFQFYIPIYGHGIGLSASAIGSVLASLAIASFIVRFALPALIVRFGEERLLGYSFYLAGAGFVLVPLFTHGVMLALVSFVFGLGMGCGQPITTMLMFSRSAAGRSGETLGLRLTANNLMRVTGPTVFGFVASAFGLASVFGISAVVMAAGGWLSRQRRVNRAAPRKD